jgi:hypothetical protein
MGRLPPEPRTLNMNLEPNLNLNTNREERTEKLER